MDVGLPDMSGYELTKQMRAQEWKLDQHVPIVALTAHIDSENKEKCIESGMDAVLSKPLMENTAKDIINAFVPSRKPVQISKEKLKEKPEAELLKITGNVIDLADGMTKINGDIETAKEMIRLLIEGFQEDLAALLEAKNKEDWDMIKSIVHKHGGGSLYCGVPRFQQACSRLENYLALKKTEMRDELFQQLLDEMDKLRNEQKNL